MNINKNNLFARYYQWIYGNLPNDVCSFFWGSLFAVEVFFLLVPGRLILGRSSSGEVVGQFFMGLIAWIGYFVSIGVGTVLIERLGYEFTNVWGFLLLGAFIGALVIGGVIALVVGTVYVSIEKMPNTTVVQNTKDFVGAVRRKHCTKINWK